MSTETNRLDKKSEINLNEMTSDTVELKKLNASLMKDKADLQDKELRYMQEIIIIEQKYTETTKALKRELESTKAELQKALEELENERQKNMTLKQEYDNSISAIIKEKDKEINNLKKIHISEIETLKYEYKQEIKVKLKEFEEENERIRAQLQRKYEFERAAKKLGEINEELKGKLQSDYSKKEAEFEAKIAELEKLKQEYKLAQEKILAEQKQLESSNRKLSEMQAALAKESDNQRQVYDYKKKLLEEQHERMLAEETTRRNKLMDEQRRFELDRAQYERDKAEWSSAKEQDKVTAMLEIKELAQRKQELDEALKSHRESLGNKLLALETQRKQLSKDEADLLRREQQCTERELVLRRQYDELSLAAERVAYERSAMENEKADVEDLAGQMNLKSLQIREANENLNQKLQDWNNTKTEIELTQENLLEYRKKMEADKDTVAKKCKELELLRREHIRRKTVDEAAEKLSKEYPLRKYKKETARPVMRSFNSTAGHFNSSAFIKNLEQEVGLLLISIVFE
eukprot:TRINITY_DN13705_c0_g1_i1.p1 TRINITY_DN13705_c0_g1~~TRINITY_DN13705_c0_g1_i1.p1  ORF type:complete len:520 (-),score=200.14 TRINITY_DN13705_c0_g1_i1:186-1745(-)